MTDQVDNWHKLGTTKTPGTKILSVSGDCPNKGIYEIEWGMKFSDFLKLTGVEHPKIVQFSGPSGDTMSISTRRSAGPTWMKSSTASPWKMAL